MTYIPTLTEIGSFAIQIVVFIILFQVYEFVKAKVNIEKLKSKRIENQILLETPKKEHIVDLEKIDKPDTYAEIIQNSIFKMIKPKKKIQRDKKNEFF